MNNDSDFLKLHVLSMKALRACCTSKVCHAFSVGCFRLGQIRIMRSMEESVHFGLEGGLHSGGDFVLNGIQEDWGSLIVHLTWRLPSLMSPQ